MIAIRNKRDLKFAFFCLYLIKKNKLDATEEKVIELKRLVRKYVHNIPDRYLVSQDNGDYIELIALPHYLQSEEEAVEYFKENEYISYWPSCYDCTGQAFTSWFKIVKRRGEWFAYHRVCYDI